jgi:phytoene dehydrogenase-like protein
MLTYDAVIIGGGHNGLVAACYLAKAGRSVAVLERRDIVGGATVTEELFPGFRCSTASYIISLFRHEIAKDLELASHGFETIAYDPGSFALFQDGSVIRFWSDVDATIREIERFSKADAAAYVRFGIDLADFGARLEPFLFGPPPTLATLGQAFSGMRGQELFALFTTMSVQDLLDHYFEHPYVKGPMIHMAMVSVLSHPTTPETAYSYGHHATGRLDGHYGKWGYVRGGMGALAAALKAAAMSHGATVRTSAEVAEILVRADRVAGVRLADGEEIGARVVLSSADAHWTLGRLLRDGVLSPTIARSVASLDFRGSMGRVFFALDRLPTYEVLKDEPPGPEYQALTLLDATAARYYEAYGDSHGGRIPRRPPIHLTIPTVCDPGLAPPGRHTLITGIQQLPIVLNGTTWETERERFADLVQGIIEEFAPGFESSILHRHVLTPMDYERIFGLTGGNIFHGSMTMAQLFACRPLPGWASYRMPVPGLYLCGSSAHPGGGVTGLPGRNAAQEVLRDWELQPIDARVWTLRAQQTANGEATRRTTRVGTFVRSVASRPRVQRAVLPMLRSPRLRWLSQRLQNWLAR